MFCDQKGFRLFHCEIEFFVKLTRQCCLHSFAILHLATWEFPQTTLMLVRWPQRQQHFVAGIEDYPGSNVDASQVRYSALMVT